MRRPFLDRVRCAAVIFVLIYHVCYLYNHAGVPGSVGAVPGMAWCDVFLYAVYPWFMALLFAVAGVCARYSLEKRTCRQFLKERAVKLLAPSTLGLFVYHWITGYLNIRIGGGLPYIPGFLLYPVCVVSGIGPLWFAQMLFCFSLLAALLRRLDKSDRLWRFCARAGLPVLIALLLPAWGAAQLGNMPVLTFYRFGIYGFCFFAGYLVLSHEEVQERLVKFRIPLLLAAAALGVGFTLFYFGRDYTTPECLQSLLTNAYLWAALLAVFACARAWWNGGLQTSPALWLQKASFSLYVLHYPVTLGACWLFYSVLRLTSPLCYLCSLAVTFLLTPLLYEAIRRIPFLRYLVLGMRGKSGGSAPRPPVKGRVP